MDDFIYQVKLKQIEDCNDVDKLITIFKELFKKHNDIENIFEDGCVNFHNTNEDAYTLRYTAILASDLLGNIYNRLIDSKQASASDLKFVLSKPFPPINKEQAIKNIKAFHGLI